MDVEKDLKKKSTKIKSKKIKSMKMTLPSKSAFPIETKPDMIKLNTLMAVIGRKGTGKNASLCSLVKMLCDDGVLDEVIVITPTYESNKDYFLQFGKAFNPENNVFEPSKTSADDIKEFVQNMADYYQNYLNEVKMIKELKQKAQSKKIEDLDIEDAFEMDILDEDGIMKNPEYKYKNKPPRVFCIVDDCIGTDIFVGNGAKKFTTLCLAHRHQGIYEEGILGCSIAILSQSLKTQQGGIPRSVRENCSCIILVGKTNDDNMNKKIWEELASFCPQEEFYKIWDFACPKEEPHSFLMMDLAPKCKAKTFRKNFDEYIDHPLFQCSCKNKS